MIEKTDDDIPASFLPLHRVVPGPEEDIPVWMQDRAILQWSKMIFEDAAAAGKEDKKIFYSVFCGSINGKDHKKEKV